jgi:hypothetical protein
LDSNLDVNGPSFSRFGLPGVFYCLFSIRVSMLMPLSVFDLDLSVCALSFFSVRIVELS